MRKKTLFVNALTYPEAFETLWSEWEGLDARLSPRTPFSSPIWNRSWWRHLARSSSLRRDEFFVHQVRDVDGKLIAVAPLMRTHVPSIGPLHLRKVQFFGTDPSLTEIRGLICQAEHEDAVIDALFDYFAGRKDWDLFKWSGIRSTAEISRIASDDQVKTERVLPMYLIPLPGRWEDLHSKLSNNTRKSIRKGYEFLQRDGHRIALRIVNGDDGTALARFFALHRARSAAPGMTPHRDNFTEPKHREFLVEVARVMGEHGLLHFFELEIDGDVVASRIAFTLGRDLYLYFSGFDPNWRQYGVMTTLVAEIIKWAIEHGFTILNLSTGKDLSKLRWQPTEILHRDVTQSSGSLRGRIALQSEVWRHREARNGPSAAKLSIAD